MIRHIATTETYEVDGVVVKRNEEWQTGNVEWEVCGVEDEEQRKRMIRLVQKNLGVY